MRQAEGGNHGRLRVPPDGAIRGGTAEPPRVHAPRVGGRNRLAALGVIPEKEARAQAPKRGGTIRLAAQIPGKDPEFGHRLQRRRGVHVSAVARIPLLSARGLDARPAARHRLESRSGPQDMGVHHPPGRQVARRLTAHHRRRSGDHSNGCSILRSARRRVRCTTGF